MSRGERVIAFIERFCMAPEGQHVGSPLRLEPFQKKFILDVYDNPAGTHTGYLSIARKNGKTALIAAIMLAHLVGPEARLNSQVVSGARSREQAAQVFNYAVKMVQLSERLQSLVRVVPSSKRMIGIPLNVEYRALAAEGRTAHGLSPVLAILDEVGQVRGPQDDFIDAITTAQGAHEAPLLLAISTQAATDADLFSIWLDDAMSGEDPHIVCHLYAAPADAEVMDRGAWFAANPALGVFRSVADMQKEAGKASRMPTAENTFRNLCLNQRVTVFSPFVSPSVWDSCCAAPASLEEAGAEVYAGLDLSSRTDLTALVVGWRDADGCMHVVPFFWTPEKGLLDRAKRDRAPYDVWAREGVLRTTPGATVDYEVVVRDMVEIFAGLNLVALGFDRWRIDVLRKECSRIDWEPPLVEFGQGFKDMSPALDLLEADLLNERVAHGGNPALTMCAAQSVVIKDPAGNRKLDKQRSTGRIDGMVAMAIMFGVAGPHTEEQGLGSWFEYLEKRAAAEQMRRGA